MDGNANGNVLIRSVAREDALAVLKIWTTSNVNFTIDQLNLHGSEKRSLIELHMLACDGQFSNLMSEAAVKLLACDPEHPEEFFGFIIADKGPIVHYAFTKYAARKLGIARLLFTEAMKRLNVAVGTPVKCSCWGIHAAALAPKYSLIYSPLR